jgi:LPXTG-site transpeptidase (sortase) family protein
VFPRVPRRWLERGLFALGLLMIGFSFRNETEARASHSAEMKQLEAARLGGGVADAPALRVSKQPWCPPTLERGVFGRIEIPRLGISAPIAEGAAPERLERAVGHISTTAFPGQAGNCALAGDRDSFLRGLGGVRENDVIRIDTLQDTYTYVVEWGRVVRPGRVDVLDATEAPSLTLVTRYPFHAAGPAPERFVVRAKLVETTAWAGR